MQVDARDSSGLKYLRMAAQYGNVYAQKWLAQMMPEPKQPQATFPGLLGAQLQAAVEKALPWYVRGLLRAHPKLFIAGGFIRDAAVRVPYHDIDIYLGGENLYHVSDWLTHIVPDSVLVKETDRGHTYDCPVTNFNTDGNAILWETRPVQLLHSAGVAETVDKFDLANCTAVYGSTRYSYGAAFVDAIRSGICPATPGRINPATYHRMMRMQQHGWEFVKEDTWKAYDCFMANGGGRDSG